MARWALLHVRQTKVLGHNDILPELCAFLLKRVKWLKEPVHVTHIIYNLYPGMDHPQGPNCRPTFPPAQVESTSQATKCRKREKGLDSTMAVNSAEVQHYGTSAPPTEYVEVSEDEGTANHPIQVAHYDDIDPFVAVALLSSSKPKV